jgi:hypothetical protein
MARARAGPFAQSSVFFSMASENIRTFRGRAPAPESPSRTASWQSSTSSTYFADGPFFLPMGAETSETSAPAAAASIDERTGARGFSGKRSFTASGYIALRA